MRTPDAIAVRIYGQFFDGKTIRPFDKHYKPEDLSKPDFQLPKTLQAKMSLYGLLPTNSAPPKELVIDDLNRARKYLGLDPLPDGFVCGKLDGRRVRPEYRLDL